MLARLRVFFQLWYEHYCSMWTPSPCWTPPRKVSHYAPALQAEADTDSLKLCNRTSPEFWTLNKSQKMYPTVEKEAMSIVEAIRHWSHFLRRKKFKSITDQRAIAYMFNSFKKSRTSRSKIGGLNNSFGSRSCSISKA